MKEGVVNGLPVKAILIDTLNDKYEIDGVSFATECEVFDLNVNHSKFVLNINAPSCEKKDLEGVMPLEEMIER